MQITLIFKNQTQVDLLRDFSEDELQRFVDCAYQGRKYLEGDLFIDFAEVIFYTLTEKETKDGQ